MPGGSGETSAGSFWAGPRGPNPPYTKTVSGHDQSPRRNQLNGIAAPTCERDASGKFHCAAEREGTRGTRRPGLLRGCPPQGGWSRSSASGHGGVSPDACFSLGHATRSAPTPRSRYARVVVWCKERREAETAPAVFPPGPSQQERLKKRRAGKTCGAQPRAPPLKRDVAGQVPERLNARYPQLGAGAIQMA